MSIKEAATQKRILLNEPEIRGNEWSYIKECLDTKWVSSAGRFVDRFEKDFAGYVGVNHAVACVNGTAALHISLIINGIQPEDEVVMPALTFVAPANTIKYVGALPAFIDVDKDTWQLDTHQLKDFIEDKCERTNKGLVNKESGRIVKAIMPVHILGHPVDMDPILNLADEYHLKVIEDATESLGASYKGRKVGGLSDVGCFSFNGNKIMTTGGGGMIVTNDQALAEKAKYLTQQAKDDPIESIHEEIGYNYRLTNIQSAFGVAQLECIDEFIEKKRRMASYYQQALSGIDGVQTPIEARWAKSVWWLYTILIDQEKFGTSSRELLKILDENGVQTRPLWHPIHQLKPFKDCFAHSISVANDIYGQGLSLPSSVGLTEEQQNRIIEVIKDAKK